MCKDQGLEVLFLHALIDTHFIQFLESKDTKIKYVSIDSELSDILVDETKSSQIVDKDNKTSDDTLSDIFKKALNDDKLKIEIKSLKSDNISAMVLEAEYVKRMKTMSHFMKGQGAPAFEDLTLVVNSNHSLVKNIVSLQGEIGKKDLVKTLCQHVYDLARMSKQQLTGSQMQAFIERSNDISSQLSNQVLSKK